MPATQVWQPLSVARVRPSPAEPNHGHRRIAFMMSAVSAQEIDWPRAPSGQAGATVKSQGGFITKEMVSVRSRTT